MNDDRHTDGRRDAFPGAVLALFDDEGRCSVRVHARPEGLREGVDPISELAVLAGVSHPPRATIIVPVRMRDVVDDMVIARSVLVTEARRLPDGRLELEAATVALREDGDLPPAPPRPVDPALSPVGSLLCDVLSTIDLSVRPEDVVAVLVSWGHVVVPGGELPPVEHARLGRARYRVHRAADELARRHRPMALADDAGRPAAPANLPPGFLPACPV